MLRGKKITMILSSAFSSESQTLPPNEWGKCQREEMFQREARTISQAARAKGVGRCLIPLLPNFSAKLFLSESNTPLTSSEWKEMDRMCTAPHLHWLHSTPFCVRKNSYKIHYNWRPMHGHSDLTSHRRAVLPHSHPTRNSAQERARQTILQQFDVCGNTNTAICSLWMLQLCPQAFRLKLCFMSTSYKFLKHLLKAAQISPVRVR